MGNVHEVVKGRAVHSATPATVRGVNRAIVLNLVRRHQPISRVDLSRRTGIFRSSISAIVDELIGDGLLVEQRSEPRGRGRVPVHLWLNPNGRRVLGISIRGYRTSIAFAGPAGRPQGTVVFETPRRPAVLMRQIEGALARLRKDMEGDHPFEHVGISVPGMVNSQSGEILMLPSLAEYAGFPIAAQVAALAGAPAVAENDCNAGALAELWLNAGEIEGLENFVFLEIGDVGVGSGIVYGGELYGGHDRTLVGEFGHMIVDPCGPECTCGRNGCWEMYVADRATWRAYDPETPYTSARFAGLLAAVRAGEARALAAARRTARYLSLGISNIAFALNPQCIILAGEITALWSQIGGVVETAHASRQVALHIRPASIRPEGLSLQGAIALALREMFGMPRLG